jgi:hypothetical protein
MEKYLSGIKKYVGKPICFFIFVDNFVDNPNLTPNYETALPLV